MLKVLAEPNNFIERLLRVFPFLEQNKAIALISSQPLLSKIIIAPYCSCEKATFQDKTTNPLCERIFKRFR